MTLKMHQFADASTSHVSEVDSLRLKEDSDYFDERLDTPTDDVPRIVAFALEMGFILHTGHVAWEHEMAGLATRYSPELLDLLRQAHEQGAHYLWLDRDGEVYPDRKTFGW